ncbi:MAG: hypothetical protein EFT35_08515 [Methanophagales archaeon ANME-1-THS]|nr:MAG: hypothetical protein EFT35_08515 [Methanophagales archaeon ANME-1-THS]
MNIPKLSEEEIKERVGAQSFERGYRYFREGAIRDPLCQGMTLKAYCEGSQPQPYRVRVSFSPDGIQEAQCSCPVGSGGYCKHVAALLLTWLRRPDEFREREELDTALEKRSKEELIALIKQMLIRQPELEMLLETPLPASGKRITLVDPEVYRRQAATAFRHIRYEWGVEADIADDLRGTLEIGDGFLEQKDYANAAAGYKAVAEEVLSHYEEFEDEGGELGGVVNDCVEGLERCLAGAGDDPVVREGILLALFVIHRSDVDFGGVGLGDDVPEIILEHASPEERRTISGWVQEVLHQKKLSDWERETYGGLLLDLEKDRLDDESFLRICRETGRLEELEDRLLTLKRLDEAVVEAKKSSDYELLRLADIFVAHGEAEIAERMIAERAKTTRDWRILEWLKKRYKERGELSEALSITQELFQIQPNLSNYQEIRSLAQQIGLWKELREQLLTELHDRYELLTEIYLDEGEIDLALEAVKRTRSALLHGFWGADLRVKVAEAAEEPRPNAAIELYRQLVEGLIDARGRGNYQQACRYLTRMHDLFLHIGRGEEWTYYIAELRERNRSLRALKEELSKAGLQ